MPSNDAVPTSKHFINMLAGHPFRVLKCTSFSMASPPLLLCIFFCFYLSIVHGAGNDSFETVPSSSFEPGPVCSGELGTRPAAMSGLFPSII